MTQCPDDILLEDVVADRADAAIDGHVRACPQCRRRLVEAQAVGHRLRAAFASVHAPGDAVERIRRATIGQAQAPAVISRSHPARRRPWAIRHIGMLATAAGVMIAASLVVVMQFTRPTEAQAAAAELVRLHEANLAGHNDMVTYGSDAEAQAYLAGKLGFTPAVPDELGNRRIRGCCVSRFLGRRAGNFVVDGPHGPISIIVSDANAQDLMTRRNIERNGRTYWVCPMQGFYTVAVQEGRLIYCAVGDDEPEHLVDLLDGILARGRTR